jgi:hypothetical protein
MNEADKSRKKREAEQKPATSKQGPRGKQRSMHTDPEKAARSEARMAIAQFFGDRVTRMKVLDLEERKAKYLDMAMKLLREHRRVEEGMSFSRLLSELRRQEEYTVLDHLEDNLDDMRQKKAIWTEVMRCPADECRSMLKRWAIENPDDNSIIPYHPEAVEILKKRILDKETTPAERGLALCALIRSSGDKKTLAFVKRYKDDKSLAHYAGKHVPFEIGFLVSKCLAEYRGVHLSE